jgi:membrane-associated phospholipid phosphatase
MGVLSPVDAFMRFMSFVGSGVLYVSAIAVTFWCVSPRAGARATVVLGLSGMLNGLLKLLFHLPRPVWTDSKIKPYQPLTSFGTPSGHAQNAAVAWGLLATEVRRRLVALAAVVVMILIGVSRIYLGVHSVDQVFVGWAIGAALLAAALLVEPYVVPRWARLPILGQLALSLLVALVFLGLDALAVRHLHGFHYPQEWVTNIRRAGGHVTQSTLQEGATYAGTVFGGLAGISLLASRGWFEPGGVELWRRLTRVPVGAAGAGVIYGVALLIGSSWPEAFVLQGLLGLWAAVGAPETFVRLELARRGTTPQVTRPGESPLEGPS